MIEKQGSPILRYMLYAIGEIVLVVIGILIAVEIGDWNSRRQEEKQEKVYLESIKQDLNDQLEVIEKQLTFELKMMQLCKEMIETHRAHNGFRFDSLLANRMFVLGSRKTLTSRTATYTEMVSSGSLSLVKNLQLKNEILNYYQELERVTTIFRTNNNMVDNTFPPKIAKYNFASNGNYAEAFLTEDEPLGVRKETEVADQNLDILFKKGQKLLEMEANELELLGLINYRSSIVSVNIVVLNGLKVRTFAVLELLNNEMVN